MYNHEADKITQFIWTDNISGINGEYDHEENGTFFVIEYNHATKKVFIHGKGGDIHERPWISNTGVQKSKFTVWLRNTITENS